MAAPVAAIVKKAVEVLASSKKGRKFIGYIVGIAIFLLLLPMIVIYGLFGWMSGSDGISINDSQVMSALTPEQQEEWQRQNQVMQRIAEEFTERNLMSQIRFAQALYYFKLNDTERGDDEFCSKLADCFESAGTNAEICSRIQETFDVSFTEQDIAELNEIFPNTGQ